MAAHDPDALAAGVLQGDRGQLSRAITLVESRRDDHQEQAQRMLQQLLPHTGKAVRLGISGVPGVGKSTLIEALGRQLLRAGRSLAVLAIDPSSRRTGGSILGDKTRMPTLSLDDRAFIRPSPTAGHLGGVTRVTRESLLVCEAAGFDVVIIETVGVGQSETVVADMVDCYLVLMLPGAGDELQGIKKGVLELADIIAVNKADGANEHAAADARAAYERALSILQRDGAWRPIALACSAEHDTGLDELWRHVEAHRALLTDNGELQARREQQQIDWLWSSLELRVLGSLRKRPGMPALIKEVEQAIRQGSQTVPQGLDTLMQHWQQTPN